jgi:hypothetical protein
MDDAAEGNKEGNGSEMRGREGDGLSNETIPEPKAG